MIGRRKVLSVLFGALALTTAVDAGMVSVSAVEVEGRQSARVCSEVQAHPTDSFSPFANPSITDLTLEPIQVSAEAGIDLGQPSQTQPPQILTDGQPFATAQGPVIATVMPRSWILTKSVAPSGEKHTPVGHWLGDETSQRRDGFFDGRSRHDGVGDVFRKAQFQLFPESVVWPLIQISVQRALNVVPTQHWAALGAQGKAAFAIGVNQLG